MSMKRNRYVHDTQLLRPWNTTEMILQEIKFSPQRYDS